MAICLICCSNGKDRITERATRTTVGKTNHYTATASLRIGRVSGRSGLSAVLENDKFQILYIEDNSANLSLVETALQHRENVELLKAKTAELGLELAREYQPGLILLDINLPGMDGYEALEHLKASPLTEDIPVIALSAHSMSADVERAREAGAQDYLVKPYSIAEFFMLIDRWTNVTH